MPAPTCPDNVVPVSQHCRDRRWIRCVSAPAPIPRLAGYAEGGGACCKGKTISPAVSLSVSPGSKQVLTMLADCGALTDILASGARRAGMRLRPLHRDGLFPELRRREPAQPSTGTLKAQRHGGRQGLSGLPGDGRGRRADRRYYRSGRTGRDVPKWSFRQHFRIDDQRHSAARPRRKRLRIWRFCAGRNIKEFPRRTSPGGHASGRSWC